MTLAAAFVRVSAGSQDLASQIKVIEADAVACGITIVKWFKLHGYSASQGTQEPALRDAIADIARGDYSLLIVTESSRLDRRDDLDAQAEILLAIRSAGGDVKSISEPQFGKTDFAGRIVTLDLQQANAEKSKIVKETTWRGVMMIRDNRAHLGGIPAFWKTEKGARYTKRAHCVNPEAVTDMYERVANGEPLSRIGRDYDLYQRSVRDLITFPTNHTGVVECSYTHDGVKETWTYEVAPVVDSALWWRANKVITANKTEKRSNKGGRPVASPARWISGLLDCPGCGGVVGLDSGNTPKRDSRTGKMRVQRPRTPKLFCRGRAKRRLVCGVFKPIDARPIIDLITEMFAADDTPVLAFQRIAGNAHELDALHAELRRIQARLSATEDDDELDDLVAHRKAVKAQIEGFTTVPDRYDYASTGRTVAQMWNDGDEVVKRGMVDAVKKAWGMSLTNREGRWGIALGAAGSTDQAETSGIVDLGNGLCFRRLGHA